MVDDLYYGWDKVRIQADRAMKNATGGKQERESAQEILLINRMAK